jgi:transcription antitermination protein NusB
MAPRRDRKDASPSLRARRLAMLALFEEEFRPGSATAALDRLVADDDVPADVRNHAAAIVAGVAAHRSELDARIEAEAPLIPVPELGRVERTILRSAIYEVLYSAATPARETMRDAVSLARIYAGDAARRLVNGVLGSVSRSSGGGV